MPHKEAKGLTKYAGVLPISMFGSLGNGIAKCIEKC